MSTTSAEARLIAAVVKGVTDEVTGLLMVPGINVNSRHGENENTPLYQACILGRDGVVAALLAHPETDLHALNKKGRSALFVAALNGREKVVKRLLASGKYTAEHLQLRASRYPGSDYVTPLELALHLSHNVISYWLSCYAENPAATTHRLRVGLLHQPERAAELFALTVAYCDGYSAFATERVSNPFVVYDRSHYRQRRNSREEAAKRFFHLAARLPLDMQMVLCLRSVGLAGDFIPSEAREAAFDAVLADEEWE